MRVRTSVAAAGITTAIALVLTGCGSDGDGGGDSSKEKSAVPGGPATSATDSATKEPASGGGDITGAWSGMSEGKPVSLGITDKKAVLVAEGHTCSGEVADHGKQMLSLTCVDGNKDRTMGTIESSDSKTLVISWDSGKKDTLSKVGAGQLPTDLPSIPKLPGA
ncbi:hypothetical protein ACFYT4_04920 [Streptomyces sp. NPDC004609]|uniref:hypothetical protein n=1 Tax=Streptomyces sp. NPDC004609 TaxID=3364704 RepID=UPI0036AA773E